MNQVEKALYIEMASPSKVQWNIGADNSVQFQPLGM